jgi:hypothetical protein
MPRGRTTSGDVSGSRSNVAPIQKLVRTGRKAAQLSAANSAGRARADDTKGPKPSELRVEVPGAPPFSKHLDRLLKYAGVPPTPGNRSALDVALKLAWIGNKIRVDDKERAPSKLLDQLDDSINKTQTLLRAVEIFKRSHDIAFDSCPIGEGTISVETAREMKFGKTLSLPRNPPSLRGLDQPVPADGMIAAINVCRLLDRVRREIRRLKRGPGRRPEAGKSTIVAYASDFFRRHSLLQVTQYPNGHFANFCKHFYEVVTGATHLDLDALQAQIRKESKRPTLGI